MILMLRKYLANHAKFNPGSFIIDTPLHGFDDGVDEDIPDSMRAGLYRYFMAHQDEGQLIIIENLDHIPHLDYEPVMRRSPRLKKQTNLANDTDS